MNYLAVSRLVRLFLLIAASVVVAAFLWQSLRPLPRHHNLESMLAQSDPAFHDELRCIVERIERQPPRELRGADEGFVLEAMDGTRVNDFKFVIRTPEASYVMHHGSQHIWYRGFNERVEIPMSCSPR